MSAHLVERMIGRPAGSFARAARRLGVTSRVVRILEPSARALFPGDPVDALESRESFEEAAMHAVTQEAGDLRLSYRTVDALASAVETLGLARASDVPDPFRRVWLADAAGARRRGVVLRCERGEVAVFCPPSREPFTASGPIFTMSYRGFSSSVEFDLKLSDVVRLPSALVVHLTRPEQGGAIGRDNLRVEVRLPATLRAVGDVEPLVWREWQAGTVLDISSGGMRIASALPFGAGQAVQLEVPLHSGEEPLRLDASICWNRTDDAGERSQGLLLSELTAPVAERYLGFVSGLLASEGHDADSLPLAQANRAEPFHVIAFEESSSVFTVESHVIADESAAGDILEIPPLPLSSDDWDLEFEGDELEDTEEVSEPEPDPEAGHEPEPEPRASEPPALRLRDERADLESQIEEQLSALERLDHHVPYVAAESPDELLDLHELEEPEEPEEPGFDDGSALEPDTRMREDLDHAQQRLLAAEASAEAMRIEREARAAERDAALQRADDLEARLQQARSRAGEESKSLLDRIGALETELAAAAASVSESTAGHEVVVAERDDLARELASSRESLATIEAELDASRAASADLERRLAEARRVAADESARVEELEALVAVTTAVAHERDELLTERDALAADLACARDSLVALENELQDSLAMASDLERGMLQSRERAAADAEKQASRIAELEAALADATAAVADHGEILTQRDGLARELDSARESVVVLERELREHQESAQELERALAETRRQAADEADRQAERIAELDALLVAATAAVEEHRAVVARRDELSREVESARTSLRGLEEEMRASEDAAQALERRLERVRHDAASESAHQASRIEQLAAQLAETAAALEATRAELANAHEALADRSSTMESAAELLARLKPMVAAIEGELVE